MSLTPTERQRLLVVFTEKRAVKYARAYYAWGWTLLVGVFATGVWIDRPGHWIVTALCMAATSACMAFICGLKLGRRRV
jgi:hypothetical protein